MRIALGLEYDGRAFSGWQSQTGRPTVQDALERALGVIAGESARLHVAGRTDAGVHAALQVAHFDTQVQRPLSAWVRGVNSHLPDSVAVRWAVESEGDFHARFSAFGRSYCYLLLNRPVRPALLSGRVGWHHLPLDVDRMGHAARFLLGTQDFSCFRAAECQAKSPVKEMREATVRRIGELIIFEFAASAFLHHMVRNMVGALVHVGKGAAEPEWVAQLLQDRDRRRAAPTFAPDGLYLCGIDYPDGLGLPDRGRLRADPLPGMTL
ncbi:tRNA pseudouridine(38-40) synthase TruA [Niveibacterium sp. SC-1]|uniref:tRNA pseudouridine(38-40) synthase TruA n=1 Tax=Niveibacterium sp. SC-1 TaxID=3135646 RepID=UPI00311FF2E4